MSSVIVKENETLDSALRRFKRNCAKAGIQQEILSEKRTKTVSIPRQICMYLCNELTNLTLTEIAVKLKRSNHSTVIHGVHKIEQDILVDKELEETINVLKKKLNS